MFLHKFIIFCFILFVTISCTSLKEQPKKKENKVDKGGATAGEFYKFLTPEHDR